MIDVTKCPVQSKARPPVCYFSVKVDVWVIFLGYFHQTIRTIIDSVNDLLVGLIAPPVEHCNGITEVGVKIPVRPKFVRSLFAVA